MINLESEKLWIEFMATTWQHKGSGGWVFVSLPSALSKKMRKQFKSEEEGWGRLKAKAQIEKTTWDTAIWFDTKSNQYLLPLKAEVRKKEKIIVGMKVKVRLMM